MIAASSVLGTGASQAAGCRDQRPEVVLRQKQGCGTPEGRQTGCAGLQQLVCCPGAFALDPAGRSISPGAPLLPGAGENAGSPVGGG